MTYNQRHFERITGWNWIAGVRRVREICKELNLYDDYVRSPHKFIATNGIIYYTYKRKHLTIRLYNLSSMRPMIERNNPAYRITACKLFIANFQAINDIVLERKGTGISIDDLNYVCDVLNKLEEEVDKKLKALYYE